MILQRILGGDAQLCLDPYDIERIQRTVIRKLQRVFGVEVRRCSNLCDMVGGWSSSSSYSSFSFFFFFLFLILVLLLIIIIITSEGLAIDLEPSDTRWRRERADVVRCALFQVLVPDPRCAALHGQFIQRHRHCAFPDALASDAHGGQIPGY